MAYPHTACGGGSTRPTGLAHAVNLDMADAGWRPTVGNYLGRVTKARILEAVREAKGESSAQLIDHLKKTEMAKEAERLLEDTHWLAEPLRLAADGVSAEGQRDTTASLPEFLAGGESTDGASSDGQPPHAVAAE